MTNSHTLAKAPQKHATHRRKFFVNSWGDRTRSESRIPTFYETDKNNKCLLHGSPLHKCLSLKWQCIKRVLKSCHFLNLYLFCLLTDFIRHTKGDCVGRLEQQNLFLTDKPRKMFSAKTCAIAVLALAGCGKTSRQVVFLWIPFFPCLSLRMEASAIREQGIVRWNSSLGSTHGVCIQKEEFSAVEISLAELPHQRGKRIETNHAAKGRTIGGLLSAPSNIPVGFERIRS
jgi:hypothetical protein